MAHSATPPRAAGSAARPRGPRRLRAAWPAGAGRTRGSAVAGCLGIVGEVRCGAVPFGIAYWQPAAVPLTLASLAYGTDEGQSGPGLLGAGMAGLWSGSRSGPRGGGPPGRRGPGARADRLPARAPASPSRPGAWAGRCREWRGAGAWGPPHHPGGLLGAAGPAAGPGHGAVVPMAPARRCPVRFLGPYSRRPYQGERHALHAATAALRLRRPRAAHRRADHADSP